MREILFRGKCLDDFEFQDKSENWVYGNLLTDYDCAEIVLNTDIAYSFAKKYVRVDPETVGQFTGLTDKNGKKIFEGDIVEFETIVNANFDYEIKDIWKDVRLKPTAIGNGYYAVRKDQAIVQWNEKKGMWDLKVYNNGRYKRKATLFTYRESGYEVIGNIHDNPELLEVGK